MKKCIAILFLLLLSLQAIPVLHFFVEKKSVFYSYVDEDKPDEAKLKIKKETKEYLSFSLPVIRFIARPAHGDSRYISLLPSPSLEFTTPPPDFAC